MTEYKPNTKFLFIVLLNIFMAALSSYCVLSALSGKIQFGGTNEKPTEPELLTVFAFVAFCYIVSSSILLLHLIKNKGNVMTMTYDGIENGLIIINVACVFVILPFKFIPWQAITEIEEWRVNFLTAKIDISKVKANPLSKLALKLFGYQFCFGATNPTLTKEDILMFSDLFSTKSSLL